MFAATTVYGAAPIRGDGPGSMMNGRMATGVGSPPTPVEAMPATMGINALSDPTLWLVLMFGAAAALAIWAEPGK